MDQLKFCLQPGQTNGMPQKDSASAVMIYINEQPLSELAGACEEIYQRINTECILPLAYVWPEPSTLYAALMTKAFGGTKAVPLLHAENNHETYTLNVYFRQDEKAVVWFGFHNPMLPGCKYPLLEPLYFDKKDYAKRLKELENIIQM